MVPKIILESKVRGGTHHVDFALTRLDLLHLWNTNSQAFIPSPLAWTGLHSTIYSLQSEKPSQQLKQSIRGRRLPCTSPSLWQQQRCLHGDGRHPGSATLSSSGQQHCLLTSVQRPKMLQPHCLRSHSLSTIYTIPLCWCGVLVWSVGYILNP